MATRRGKRWIASGYDKALGRKKHLGTFDSHKEAVQAEADWKLRARGTARETCDEFATRWPVDYPRPREATNLTNIERLKPFIKDFTGVLLADVDKPTARAWALKHKHQTAAVRAMFADAVQDGLLVINPFAELRIGKGRGRKDIVTLTEKQLQALAGRALTEDMEMGEYAPQYRAMVLFAGYVGLRPGELFALQAADIEGQLCHVRRSLSSKTHQIGPTKNGKTRIVTIPPVAQDALLEVPAHPSGLLFTTPGDRQWTQPSNHRYWKLLRTLAGHAGLDFYELRHCAATMLLERGVSPWDVAIQLGHEDGGRLVQTLYGHPSHAGARARLIAAWDASTGPTPIDVSGSRREQAS